MFEIFGISMSIGWYIVVFTICQLINVALNTVKTIIMHKEEKISSAIINAITYGFYAIIVVMTASALDLWITIIISAVTNLIGVYGSMWVLERFKHDSLWEIVATVQNTEMDNYKQFLNLIFTREHISFNCMETNMKGEYVYHIYSESQKQSEIIKKALSGTNAKYIVHEERVRL
jgi:uncharacterized protein YebE (UPF0316 family)